VSLTLACHTLTFEMAQDKKPQPITDRKTFWFWGLTPTQQVDVQAICPTGVAEIQEETTFSDGLFSLLTLGIYSPRTSLYYCRPDGAPA